MPMIFPASQKSARYAVITAALFVMAGLLFVQLGHYALWDDETMVGLVAKGVLRTGDTSVLMDHGNVVTYRGGILVKDFRDRSTPPLATYLAAVSFSLLGINAWTARLPFAMFGLATVTLILYWARRESWPVLLVLIAGLLGNVSLILFFRQCRYFGPTIFFSVAIAFVYWRWKPTPRTLLILASLSVLLFVSNYMNYLALYLCLAIDYVIWKRKEWPPTWRNSLLLFGPQLILNGAIAFMWNPLRTQFSAYEAINSICDRLTLFFWYWRDMDRSEYFSLPVILLALVVGLRYRRVWMVRGFVAMVIYVVALSLVSPQPINLAIEGDIRYLPALIPLAITLEAGTLCALLDRRKVLLAVATAVVFGTNFLNGGWLFDCGLNSILVNNVNGQPLLDNGIRVTIFDYIKELIHPQPEPYSPTAQWINEHVPEGDSIWVLPDYAAYPLMFHAPRALYAWQLNWPPRPYFAGLPLIHFMGQEPPDYFIAFGPALNEMTQAIQNWNRPGVTYERVATITVFWMDLYRPELLWHTFEPITKFDLNSQAVYIFQRIKPPISAPH